MATKSNSRNSGKADLDHEDELTRMMARLYGLECAIADLIETNNWSNGVHQLIQDIIEKMEKCAADFEDVRKVRDKNSQQAQASPILLNQARS